MNIKNTAFSFLLILLCNTTIYSLRPEDETPERLKLLGEKLDRIIQRKKGDEKYNQKQRALEAQMSEYIAQCQAPYDALSECMTKMAYYNYPTPKKSPNAEPKDIERATLCKFLYDKLTEHGEELRQGTRWSLPIPQDISPKKADQTGCSATSYWEEQYLKHKLK